MKKGVKFLDENASDVRVTAWNLYDNPQVSASSAYGDKRNKYK
jgi:hypothetical protein